VSLDAFPQKEAASGVRQAFHVVLHRLASRPRFPVHVSIGPNDSAWFSWDEWRDFARRIEHAIEWIEANTPADATGSSFTGEEAGDG
jgi:hypothetical protein